MHVTPAEFIKPVSFEKTANPMVLKPTFGSVGTQFVEFKQIEEYSSVESEKQNKEVKIPVEICLIQNDRFSKVPIRVNDLSARQKVELAPLYERFKSQKDSKETNVLSWDAASDLEKGLLMSVGVGSVEQLSHFSDDQIHRLGPSGVDLRSRARKHMLSKEERKNEEASEELRLLRREKEEMALRLQKLEETMYANLAKKVEGEKEVLALEAPKKKGGRPKKVIPEQKEAA